MLKIEYLNNKIFESNIAKFKQSKQEKARYELIIEDLSESHKKTNCVFKTKLLVEKQTEYKKILKDYTESQGQLAMAFFTLSENLIRYRKFHFVDVDDAIQEFVMTCFDKIERFDPNKGKAFNYMTTCILNTYRQLYRTARNYNELKRKYQGHLQTQSESNGVKNKKKHFPKEKFQEVK